MTWQFFVPIIWCLSVVRSQYETYGENVAYGKPANQSTTYQEYNASLGVDGGISTNFDDGTCSHTDAGHTYAWWTVDLVGFYFIKFIRIYQRTEENRLRGSKLYAKEMDNTWTQINFSSDWPPSEFNVSVELNKPIGEIMLNNSMLQVVLISVCELQAFKVIECVHFSIENGSIEVVKYGDANQTFTFGTTFNVTCHEGYRMLDDGVLANETESILECNATGNWSRNLTCSVTVCGRPPNIPNNSKEILTPGIAGNYTYNATMTVECNEGYNYSLHEIEPLRCGSDGLWTGNLGSCNVIDCGQPRNIPDNIIITSSTGLAGNTSYNTTLTIECNIGFKYTLPGNKTIRCGKGGHWTGILGLCEVIDCGQPLNIPGNSTIVFSTGLAGHTSYNATFTIHCKNGFHYTLPGNETFRCSNEGHWTGYLGLCKVTRCTEIVPPEYGVIVVEAGTEGRWSFNTTVAIICNTGYSLNGETLIKCLETGRWTNALGYCLALRETNAEEEENKTCLLGWIITGPLCLILLVTNIATYLRFRMHKCFKRKKRNHVPDDLTTAHKVNDSDLRLQAKEENSAYDFVEDSNMGTPKNKINQSSNNAMEPYDNLQMQNRAKSEYDQLTFERESSLKTNNEERDIRK